MKKIPQTPLKHLRLQPGLMALLHRQFTSLAYQILCEDMEVEIYITGNGHERNPEVAVFKIHGDDAGTVGEVAERIAVFITEFVLGSQPNMPVANNITGGIAKVELLRFPRITIGIDNVVITGGCGIVGKVLRIQVEMSRIGSMDIIFIISVGIYSPTAQSVGYIECILCEGFLYRT